MIKLLYFILSYLLGNFMTAYLVAKQLGGIDIRQHGSGNVGARNAGRILGKKAFLITFIGDASKGAIVVLGAKWLGFSHEWQLFAMLCVLIGHVWPILFKLKGGKGVATYIGGILALDPKLSFIMVIIFLLFYLLLRSLTIAGLSVILISSILIYLDHYSQISLYIYVCIVALLMFTQRKNIKKKMNRTNALKR